jgi:hypothetical protein
MKPVLTPFGLVIGKLAVKFAEENGLMLNAEECVLGPAKSISPDEALNYLAIDERLVWLELS